MHIFGLTIEGHGHNILAQSVPVEQEKTGLDKPSFHLVFECSVLVPYYKCIMYKRCATTSK